MNLKHMNWDDLEAGDEVKFTKEARKYWATMDWARCGDCIVKIDYVDEDGADYIYIGFHIPNTFIKDRYFLLDRYGKIDNIQIFELVELRKEI